jgi:hypothetical protein
MHLGIQFHTFCILISEHNIEERFSNHVAIAGVTVGFALANKIPPQFENCEGYSKHPSEGDRK